MNSGNITILGGTKDDEHGCGRYGVTNQCNKPSIWTNTILVRFAIYKSI